MLSCCIVSEPSDNIIHECIDFRSFFTTSLFNVRCPDEDKMEVEAQQLDPTSLFDKLTFGVKYG